jgi:APA family basic amino acid/polyamine antiporter
VAAEVVRSYLGPTAVALVAMAMMLSTLGSLHTSTMTGGRVLYALARDRMFPAAVGRVGRRSRVPVNALLVHGAWTCVLALSGSFDALTDYVIFASWIFYSMNVAGVFVLRRRRPEAERPYRTLGYPVLPLLFLAVAGWLIVNTVTAAPLRALAGLGLIALGLPVYAWFARRA